MPPHTELSVSDNGTAQDGASQAHAWTLSFGRSAIDVQPISRTFSFDELAREFSTPDLGRGTLSSAEYHALDRNDPAQKARRNREKDGKYLVAG